MIMWLIFFVGLHAKMRMIKLWSAAEPELFSSTVLLLRCWCDNTVNVIGVSHEMGVERWNTRWCAITKGEAKVPCYGRTWGSVSSSHSAWSVYRGLEANLCWLSVQVNSRALKAGWIRVADLLWLCELSAVTGAGKGRAQETSRGKHEIFAQLTPDQFCFQ